LAILFARGHQVAAKESEVDELKRSVVISLLVENVTGPESFVSLD